MANNPNFRIPRVEGSRINTAETLTKALRVGNKIETLIAVADSNSLGLNFFTQFVRPDQLFLLVNNENIDQISAIVESGDLDKILAFLAQNCMAEFTEDARQHPEDRQFPDQTLEFLQAYREGQIPVEA